MTDPANTPASGGDERVELWHRIHDALIGCSTVACHNINPSAVNALAHVATEAALAAQPPKADGGVVPAPSYLTSDDGRPRNWSAAPAAYGYQHSEVQGVLAAAPPLNTGPEVGGGGERRRMAEGCCSAISPCSHQQRDPYTICEICQNAAGLAAKIAAAPGADDEARELAASERISAAQVAYDGAMEGYDPSAPDHEVQAFDAMKAAIAVADALRPAPAEAGEDLAGLSARATPGLAIAEMDSFKLRVGPPGSTCGNDLTTVALCSTCDKAHANLVFLAELWNAYRSARLTPAASRPVEQGEPVASGSGSGDLREAALGVTASLVAAVSLLEGGGRKAAASDRMFKQMLHDYRKAIEQARAALSASIPDLGAQGEPVDSGDLINDLHEMADELSADEYSEAAERIRDAIDEIERLRKAPTASRPAVGREEIAATIAQACGYGLPVQWLHTADAILALLNPRDDTRAGGADAQEGGDQWPNGCIKPSSCARHRQCMYGWKPGTCPHLGKDLTAAVEAASPPSPAPETRDDTRDGGV